MLSVKPVPVSTRYLILTAIIAVFIMMNGCSKPDDPKYGSLSGTIVLTNDTGNAALDPSDYSGVIIALYRLTQLDTTLVRINQEYPTIGVMINQQTEFDHRLQEPINTSTTAADGSFNLDAITPGTYNLAILKSGWSLRYVYNVQISSGENVLPGDSGSIKTTSLTLYPARIMPNVVQEATTFLDKHTYIFNSDTNFLSDIVVEPGAFLAVAAGKQISFHASIQVANGNGYWRLSSSHSLDLATHLDSLDRFHCVNILQPSGAVSISKLIMDHSSEGLKVLSNSFQLEDSILRLTSSLALLLQSQQNMINRTLLYKNKSRGIHSAVNTTSVSHCIFHNNEDPLQLMATDSTVQDSYFSQNFIGIRPIRGACTISNNCFDQNDNAISLSASNPAIRLNNFYQNTIDIELNYMYEDGLVYCSPTISQNNFLGSGFYVHCRGVNSYFGGSIYSSWAITANQTYPDNYLIEPNLQTHIYDANYPGVSQFDYTVSFIPRRSTSITNAGIL